MTIINIWKERRESRVSFNIQSVATGEKNNNKRGKIQKLCQTKEPTSCVWEQQQQIIAKSKVGNGVVVHCSVEFGNRFTRFGQCLVNLLVRVLLLQAHLDQLRGQVGVHGKQVIAVRLVQ